MHHRISRQILHHFGLPVGDYLAPVQAIVRRQTIGNPPLIHIYIYSVLGFWISSLNIDRFELRQIFDGVFDFLRGYLDIGLPYGGYSSLSFVLFGFGDAKEIDIKVIWYSTILDNPWVVFGSTFF